MGIREDRELTDLHDLLRQHGMVPDVPDALLARQDAERLLRQVLESPPGAPGRLTESAVARHQTGRAVRRGRSLSAAAAAVLVVALLGVQTTRPDSATAATPPLLDYTRASSTDIAADDLPDAHDALLDLAAVARSTPEPARGGPVQHVVAQEWLLETTIDASRGAEPENALYPTRTDLWVSPDGSGQVTQRRSAAVTYDGMLDPDAGPSTGGSASTDEHPAGTWDATLDERLPRDPVALATHLVDTGATECALDGWSGYCLGEQIQSRFLGSVVPQDLAASFWEVLAAEPTVRLLGETEDRLGRDGTAFLVPVPTLSGPSRDESSALVLVVSPETGQLLSTETLTTRSVLLGIDEPTVTGFSAVTSSGYTQEVGR